MFVLRETAKSAVDEEMRFYAKLLGWPEGFEPSAPGTRQIFLPTG